MLSPALCLRQTKANKRELAYSEQMQALLLILQNIIHSGQRGPAFLSGLRSLIDIM
jgi:hypothetical protein